MDFVRKGIKGKESGDGSLDIHNILEHPVIDQNLKVLEFLTEHKLVDQIDSKLKQFHSLIN